MTPWHLGTLHPVEQVLTILLAFGPFLILGVVIVVQRRRDAREDEAADRAAPREPADPTTERGRETS